MTARAKPLPVFDRRTGRLFEEFMKDALQTYETRPRRSLRQWLEAQPLYDRLIALYQESPRSRKNIQPFIEPHAIDMSEFKPVAYRSYAEFFDREFLRDARPFTQEPDEMPAFAEARYFGWERLDPEQRLPIKGKSSMPQGSSARRSARHRSSEAQSSWRGFRPWITTICITRMTAARSIRIISAEAYGPLAGKRFSPSPTSISSTSAR
jgi:hypothetical protein